MSAFLHVVGFVAAFYFTFVYGDETPAEADARIRRNIRRELRKLIASRRAA